MSAAMFVRMAAGVALAAVVSAPAHAQGPASARSYAVMYGGLSNTEVSSGAFGGNFGFSLTPDLQLFADLSRSHDVKAPFTAQDLSVLENGISSSGIPFTAGVNMAVNYYGAGLKYLVPLRSVRPYVSVHGGLAHMSPDPVFTAYGVDMTAELRSRGVNNSFREETQPMAGIGTGVLFTAGHAVFDAGYKYSAIFIPTDYLQSASSPHSHTYINTHQFTGGVGFRF